MPLEIIRNDITLVKADAIVNTANPEVFVGSGVDGAIYNAAGKEELLKEREKIGRLAFGEVGVTPAFNLKAKYIFHASGPVYIDGQHNEAQLMQQCYEKCMELAIEKKCKSIAFPLMGTGSYGYPRSEAFSIATTVFTKYLTKSDILVYLVIFDDKSFGVTSSVFPDVKSYIDAHYVEEKIVEEYEPRRRRRAFADAYIDERDLECYEASICYSEAIDSEPEESLPRKPKANKAFTGQVGSKPSYKDLLDEVTKTKEKSFGYYLTDLIYEKGMSNQEVYKNANIDKKYFSKIINDRVHPNKQRMLCLAVALRLDEEETKDFLARMDYAINPSSKSDLIFMCFIENKNYNIYAIDVALYDNGCPTIITA
ncbi:MAG: macro domain-containing protein [Erysipelotrichaceae bacterium]|nr:macro domain-containing protein [Erysipelotrichaceae bacterium]